MKKYKKLLKRFVLSGLRNNKLFIVSALFSISLNISTPFIVTYVSYAEEPAEVTEVTELTESTESTTEEPQGDILEDGASDVRLFEEELTEATVTEETTTEETSEEVIAEEEPVQEEDTLFLNVMSFGLFSLPSISWPSSWVDYLTKDGRTVNDFEDDKYGFNDDSNGGTNVSPTEIDIASGALKSGSNPGDYPSLQYYYNDGGTNLCSASSDDVLYIRMRLDGSLVAPGGSQAAYTSYHWDFLVDINKDGLSDFVIDVFGGSTKNNIGGGSQGTVGVYPSDTGATTYTPANVAWFARADDTDNLYTRVTSETYGDSNSSNDQYYMEVAIPLGEVNGSFESGLCGDRDLSNRLFASTSASNTDPLQKDWMGSEAFFVSYDESKDVENVTRTGATTEANPARPGDVLRYTLSVENDGTRLIPGFVIYDDISDILQYAALTSTDPDGNGKTAYLDGDVIKWPARDIAVGATISEQFEVTVKPADQWPTGDDFVLTNVYGDTVNVHLLTEGAVIACKYEDLNGNGAKNDSEPMLSGWTMTLNSGTVQQTTEENGCTTFTNVPAGRHTVTETLQNGWYNSTALTQNVEVAVGQTTTVNFGNYQKATLNVTKDIRASDGLDLSDGHSFVVKLNGGNAQTISETLTASYLLNPGTYSITEQTDNDYEYVSCTPDNDSNAENGAQVSVTSGQTVNVTCTNKQKPANITVIKDVRNSDGSDVSDDKEFTVRWSGGSTAVSEQANGSFELAPGIYTFTEDDEDSYTLNSISPDADSNADNGTTVSLGSNENLTITFTNYQNVSLISGFKLVDEDGLFVTAGDRIGVPGWQINLYQCAFGYEGCTTLAGTTTTGENGFFSFDNLISGFYRVEEALVTGWTNLTSWFRNVEVGPGESSEDNIFINFENVSVTACKVIDSDGDLGTTGDQTPYEGWSVSLYDADVLVSTTTTGSDGCYTWNNLEPGSYSVSEEDVSGYIPLTQTSVDFGQSASGSDYLHTFVNFAGATITVNKVVVLADGTTIADGDDTTFEVLLGSEAKEVTQGNPAVYSGLIPGTYVITESTSADGYSLVSITDNETGTAHGTVTVSSGGDYNVTVTNKRAIITVLASKIVCDREDSLPDYASNRGGAPFIDADTASDFVAQNEDHCWLESDWEFEWKYGEDGGSWNQFDGTTGTNGEPAELFIDDLQSYDQLWFREVLHDDYIGFDTAEGPSAEFYCQDDGRNYDNMEWITDPEYGSTYYCVAWNAPKYGSVDGVKFYDYDSDGVKGENEPVLEGWKIYVDYNWNGKLDEGEPFDYTNENGEYYFDELTAYSTYRIREILPEGWAQIEPAVGYHEIDVEPGVHYEGRDFANRGDLTLWGFKYEDLNGNGEIDEGEQGIEGWEIELCEDYGSSLQDNISELYMSLRCWTTYTDEDGYYRFSELEPGSYKITEETRDYYNVVYPEGGVYDDIDALSAVNQEQSFDFYNQPYEPRLLISKWNDADDTREVWDVVEYTLMIEALDAPIENVLVTDLLPKGFEYITGSWTYGSDTNEELSVGEPTYASPGVWSLGTLVPGEIVTLTYKALIKDEVDAGTYKDLAWARGLFRAGNVYAEAQEDGYIDDTFVGTEVDVTVEPEPEIAEADTKIERSEVLGISKLPATGAPTVMLALFLLGLLVGLVVVGWDWVKPDFRAAVKKVLVITLFMLMPLLASGPQKAYAAGLFVRLGTPESPAISGFNLIYTTLDTEGRSITARCYKQGPSDGEYVQFGSTANLQAGGDTSSCAVNNSVLSANGTYKFKVTATAGEDTAESDEVTVDFNGDKPGKPRYIEKDKEGSCRYEVTFKTSNDNGKTSYVEVYRSEDKEFTTDSGSRIRTITIGSDEKYTFDDNFGGSECGRTYYYAVRAFTSAGVGSDVRAEDIEDINVKTVYETEEETAPAIVTTGAGLTGLGTGEEELPTGETGEEGEVLGEQENEQDSDVEGFFNDVADRARRTIRSPWTWLSLIAIAAIGYRQLKRRGFLE